MNLRKEGSDSIPQRFQNVVRQCPEGLALKMGDLALTDDELNRRANRVAHTILKERGEGSEPIALLFEHGIDVIAAIFGVLKTGKFFVALDSSLSKQRI